MKNIQKHFTTQYVGQDPNFQVEKGAYINKSVCGCGITHFLLTNNENVIVAVPTKNLIKNKVSQLEGLLAVDGETSANNIADYIRYKREGQIKIMVTYDSIYKVEYLIGKCRLVIDEVQSFFKNYNTKTDIVKLRNLYKTTLGICEKHKDNITFVSATPIPVEYFPQWVQELQQVDYVFEYTYKRTPIVSKVNNPMRSLIGKIIRPIIENGSVTIKDKTFKKCLIFVNSITDVLSEIEENHFDVNLFGIYCGDTVKNEARLTEMGIRRFTGLWDLPQFAFVTKSGFEGCDFYDKEAMTIVVSQCNKDYKMVDINTDLIQAVARLRNDDNPNKDRYIFLYNQTVFTKTEEELLSYIQDNKERLQDCCDQVNDVMTRKGAKETLLKDSEMVAFTIQKDNQYMLDEVAFNALIYQVKEVRSKFLKGFELTLGEDSVFENLEVAGNASTSFKSIMDKVANGETLDVNEKASKWAVLATEYYETFGTTTTNTQFAIERLEAHKSQYSSLNVKLEMTIQASFNKYTKYPVSDVKNTLQKLYNDYGIARKAKATDLSEFAECEFKAVSIGGYKTKGVIINSWKTTFSKSA